jgi:hypothetical protein
VSGNHHQHGRHEGEDDGVEHAAEEGEQAQFQRLEHAAADDLIEQDDELRQEDEHGGEAEQKVLGEHDLRGRVRDMGVAAR